MGHVNDWIPDEPDDSLPTQVAPKQVDPKISNVQIGPRKGHVVVVHSLSGGTGKTTIATNIAAVLKREGKRVLLIDCALQSGDVAAFLNLQARYTIRDLVDEMDHLDIESVDRVLVNHESGISVLLAPRTPQDAESITAGGVGKLIEKLCPNFDFIVIDTTSYLNDLNFVLFELADRILHICNPTLPCVKNTRTVFDLMNILHYAPSKCQLVMNRVNTSLERDRVNIAVGTIEKHFMRKALGVIPMDERRVQKAINHGMPLVSRDKDTSPAKELIALADALFTLCISDFSR